MAHHNELFYLVSGEESLKHVRYLLFSDVSIFLSVAKRIRLSENNVLIPNMYVCGAVVHGLADQEKSQ